MQLRVSYKSKPHKCTFAWITLRGGGKYVEVLVRTCSTLKTCKDKRRYKFALLKQHIAEGHKHGIKYDPGLLTLHVNYHPKRKMALALSMAENCFVILLEGDEHGGIICSTKPFEGSIEMHWWSALQYMENIYVHGLKVGKFHKMPRKLEARQNTSWSGMSNCKECSRGRKHVHYAAIRHDDNKDKSRREKVSEIYELGRLMLADGQSEEDVDRFVKNRLDNIYDGFD